MKGATPPHAAGRESRCRFNRMADARHSGINKLRGDSNTPLDK